ncbi:Transmembrane 9 super member 9 [Lathyrus oleraceus]|uniref:Transmembrane 9 superfamily member n=2 Tax=Pisum sativum TaxID=3888 RepID=A0A9D4XX38_PEA|nr:Transmembrane 9 super member 9 [Pisum sativum]
MVEALICTQNWLKPSDNDLNVLNMTEEYEISESIVSEFQVATGGAAAPTQAGPGEAKSAELIGQAIANNPAFIALRKIEAAREIGHIIANAANKRVDDILQFIADFTVHVEGVGHVCRILDNLPLVVPIKRVDQDSTVYQLGFHVGLKGQYSGVCSLFYESMSVVVNANYCFVLTMFKYTEQGREVFYTQEEAQEETGWKLVHGDVFRPPNNSDLLCVYVGTGVQFFGMILVTMLFAVLGFLSPSNRGGLMTVMLLLWVFMGLLAGYASARLYKMFKGSEWKKISLRTAVMFPASVSAIFFVLNGLIWGQKSSGAVPFGTMFALIFLWFGISVPLVFVGGYVGFRKPAIENPVKTNKIPRQIPEQAWYMNPAFSVLIGGYLELFSLSFSSSSHQSG